MLQLRRLCYMTPNHYRTKSPFIQVRKGLLPLTALNIGIFQYDSIQTLLLVTKGMFSLFLKLYSNVVIMYLSNMPLLVL